MSCRWCWRRSPTTEEELRAAPYQVLQDWQRYYGGNLLIVLPDAFGTAAFLRDAPDWVADWTGFRPDSAPPIEGGEKIIDWWREKGRDPREKLLIFSDGLDVDTIEETYRHFQRQGAHGLRLGHQPHQRFRGLRAGPRPTASNAISLVCKVTEANGRPAVKLSDNPAKATGDEREIERYLQHFRRDGPRRAARQGVRQGDDGRRSSSAPTSQVVQLAPRGCRRT